MLTKEELKELVIKEQEDLQLNAGIKRDLAINLKPRFASIVSGVRRCGKSTFARQLLKQKKPVYYLNFENIALSGFNQEDFLRLDKVFRETLGERGIYFFDEIQNIPRWEAYVRNLVDKNNKVLITGSNASMLSRELGTKLTGRHLSYALYPFSYNEFLRLKKKKPSKNSFYEYLKKGGFPEYLKTSHKDIIRNLFQDIFYRDILVRNEFRSEAAIKHLLSYISSNISRPISYNKLKTIVGVGSVNSITHFMDSFEQAYLFFQLKKYEHSYKKQLVAPKKIYCIDNAFINLNSFSISPDYGRLLENTVFLELLRQGHNIYYHSKNHECDFVIMKGTKITKALQVCYQLTPENKEREIAGLTEACKTHNLKEGFIITFNQQDEFTENKIKIRLIPAWKWLLEKKY